MQPQTIDPTIKALVSAIGEAETGTTSPEAYRKRGASGEYGRYQFMPDTWNQYATELGIRTPLELSSIEEQNKVAYRKIEQWKQQGFTPAQIASMWNAGPDDPDAYKGTFSNGNPSVGTNSQGVQYNVPEYTRKVSEAYQRLKGQTGGVLPAGGAPIPGMGQGQTDGTFLGDVGQSFGTVGNRLANAVGRGISGEINPFSAVLQSAGAIGGGIGDLTTNVLEHTPVVKTVYKGLVDNIISPLARGVAESEQGSKLITRYDQWAKEHPEAAENVKSAFDVATAIPVAKAAGTAVKAGKQGLKGLLTGSKNAVYEAVAPKLTPKTVEKAILQRGTEKVGLLRQTKLVDDPFYLEVAKVVEKNVPKFNPGKSFVENIDEVQKVTTKLKNELKKGVIEHGSGRIFTKKELMSRLKKLDLPDLIASDATLKNVYQRLIKRVDDLAASKAGKVDQLLDLRQEFDAVVKRQFPNLYRSEALTPLRKAVTDIRDEITKFTAENLPKGFGLEDKLFTQHQLIKAIENMASKASSGATKEIGKNILTDKFKKTRGLIKAGVKAGAEGVGIGGIIKLMD